ncbi:unnamed protein product [Rodentolepis nana]|uniref:Uncharacterized protein n=1 Tax=Rodentolepis nana TaxID=102285 RepID=A0A3P7VM79_RODNA|nr:unnamed protein product [Rodentolepis nana]VDO15202.1 unnamed protein product [Rodentolepis nana]
MKVVSSKHKLYYSDLDLEELRLADGNGDVEHFQRGPNGVDVLLCPL